MQSRRNVELTLLIIALALTVGAHVIVGLTHDNRIPLNVVTYGMTMAALFLGGHLVLRWRAPQADPVLLPAAALLNGLGLVMIQRLDLERRADAAAQAPSQALWATIGFAVFALVIVLIKDYRRLDGYPFTWLLVGTLLLLSPLIPGIGREINGARLWLDFGFATFQPAEAAKLALAIFFAAYLRENRELLATATYRLGPFLLPQIKYFLPLVSAWGVSLLVLFYERDLGSSLLFFGMFIALLYIATGRSSYALVGLMLFALGAVVAYNTFGHVETRVQGWLDPLANFDSNSGFQLSQSLFAFGTGGILGTGWAQGHPNLIPIASSDFIFAAFGEELGLIGTTAILLIFLIMVFRGFRIALTANDEFGRLLASGLVAVFALQVFVIVGGVTKLIPLTGLTLPFMSQGGSSLLANYALIALLLGISAESAPAPVSVRDLEAELPEDGQPEVTATR
jgi:cell division protein FtsW (lipid II flippase)